MDRLKDGKYWTQQPKIFSSCNQHPVAAADPPDIVVASDESAGESQES
jgi:hypothetical protein